MPFERERKFLVKEKLIPEPERSVRIIQGYLSTHPARTVRVRLAGDEAFLTIKGSLSGISRMEFEYPIPVEDARELLYLTVSAPVEKIRKEIHVEGKKWEIDFFEGANKGLVLAEIELNAEDEEFILPKWTDKEVTGDWRYHNSQLAIHPYSEWR
jgi:adenylate cyclase